MTTKAEIEAAITAIDGRVEALRDRIIGAPETPIADSEWRVRDALSHLAARSNGVQRVVDRAEAAAKGESQPAPPTSIDDINAGQVSVRSDRLVEALLDEIRDGHAAAIEALADLSDELLATEIAMGFRPGEIAVADMILRGGPGHDSNHFDGIEAALGA